MGKNQEDPNREPTWDEVIRKLRNSGIVAPATTELPLFKKILSMNRMYVDDLLAQKAQAETDLRQTSSQLVHRIEGQVHDRDNTAVLFQFEKGAMLMIKGNVLATPSQVQSLVNWLGSLGFQSQEPPDLRPWDSRDAGS